MRSVDGVTCSASFVTRTEYVPCLDISFSWSFMVPVDSKTQWDLRVELQLGENDCLSIASGRGNLAINNFMQLCVICGYCMHFYVFQVMNFRCNNSCIFQFMHDHKSYTSCSETWTSRRTFKFRHRAFKRISMRLRYIILS